MFRIITLIVTILAALSGAACAGITPTTGPWGLDAAGFGSYSTAKVAAAAGAVKKVAVTKHMTVNGAITVDASVATEVIAGGGFVKGTAGAIHFKGPFSSPQWTQVFFGFAPGDITFDPGTTTGVSPDQWGATGIGTTGADLTPMQSAFQVAVGGVPLRLRPGANYDLGTAADGANLLAATGAQLVIQGLGTTISTHTSTVSQSHVLALTNPLSVRVDGVNFSNPGSNNNVDWQGVHHIYVIASGSSGTYGNITLNNVTADSGIAPITIAGATAAARIAGIRFEGNCVFTGTYYGPLFQHQGDNVSGAYTCVNVRRAYYSYGVRNHDLTIRVQNDGNIGSTGCLAITSSSIDAGAIINDTRSLRIRAVFTGTTSVYSSLVYFQLKGDTAVIDDVHVDISLTNATWTSATDTVYFRAYDANSNPQSTTSSRWDHIHLSGDFIRGTGVAQSVYVFSTQTTTGQLTIDTPFAGDVGMAAMPTFPGFTARYLPAYTEGTWTPADNSGASLTFSTAVGHYTKIGRMVYASYAITFPTTSSSASVKIGGLPVTAANINSGGSISMFGGCPVYTDYGAAIQALVYNADTNFTIYNFTPTTVTNAQMSGKTIRGTLVYEGQ